jgi:hypothetical protein
MKIKTPTEFETFNSGICEIWKTERNRPKEKLCSLHYGEQATTYRRYFSARAAQVRIDKTIHVPKRSGLEYGQRVKLGGEWYTTEQVQPLDGTNPPVCVLSLRKLEVQS